MKRRDFLSGVAASAAAMSLPHRLHAQEMDLAPEAPGAPSPMPVGFVGHGGPNLPVSQRRGPELRAWGRTLPRPTGIVAVTPHFRARGILLGAVGPGRPLMSMPRRFQRQLDGIDYRTPDNSALADRLTELLASGHEVRRSERRRGIDHTSWGPLALLYPDADVPVLEIALPFAPDPEIFALGQTLAPLRDEGVFVLASGNLTHNLASMGRPAAPWAREFDDWVAETLSAGEVDALVDWRQSAPAPELAHPDDGGHYDVLLVALGALVGTDGRVERARFPQTGFTSSISDRCVELT